MAKKKSVHAGEYYTKQKPIVERSEMPIIKIDSKDQWPWVGLVDLYKIPPITIKRKGRTLPKLVIDKTQRPSYAVREVKKMIRFSGFAVLYFLFGMFISTCHPQPAYPMGLDKVTHATSSACVYGFTALVGNSGNHDDPDLLLPLAVTMGLGLFKELTDQKFDTGDLLADGVGAVGAWVTFEVCW